MLILLNMFFQTFSFSQNCPIGTWSAEHILDGGGTVQLIIKNDNTYEVFTACNLGGDLFDKVSFKGSWSINGSQVSFGKANLNSYGSHYSNSSYYCRYLSSWKGTISSNGLLLEGSSFSQSRPKNFTRNAPCQLVNGTVKNKTTSAETNQQNETKIASTSISAEEQSLLKELDEARTNASQPISNPTKDQIKNIYVNTKRFLAQKNYEKAIDELEKVNKMSPDLDFPTIQFLKAKSYIGAHRYLEAKEELNVLEKRKVSDQISKELPLLTKQINQGINESATYEKYNVTLKKQLQLLEAMQEGKVYVFKHNKFKVTKYNTEVSYFVYFGNKYLILTLPNKEVITRFDKNTIRFTSQDADFLYKNNKLTIMYAPKTKTYSGVYSMAFLVLDPDRQEFIGGEGDAMIQFNRSDHYANHTWYYFFVNNALWVASKFGSEYCRTGEVSNPIIETGELKRYIDYRYITDVELINQAKKLGVQHKQTNNLQNANLLSIGIQSSGFQSWIFSRKDISYKVGGDCCNKVNIIENEQHKTWSGFQYMVPSQQQSYYSFVQTQTSFNSENLLDLLYNTSIDMKINSSQFEDLYNNFKTFYGENQLKTFTSTSYNTPYSVFNKLAQVNRSTAITH